MVREPDATRQPTPHDIQLMSKHRVLSLKPQLRLERRGQDGQNETEQPDHSASLGDSITSSTWIRFSVHTAALRQRLHARGVDAAELQLDIDKGPVPPSIGPEIFFAQICIPCSSITASGPFCLPRRILRWLDAWDLPIVLSSWSGPVI